MWIIKYIGVIVMCFVGWFDSCSFMINLLVDLIVSDIYFMLFLVLVIGVEYFCVWYVLFV